MARSPRPDEPVGHQLWSRRELLSAGGASILGAVSLAGCSLSNPAVNAPTVPTRSGTQTPSAPPSPARPGYPGPAGQEQALANLAATLRRRTGLSGVQTGLLDLLVAAHTDHARVLASADPATRSVGRTAGPVVAGPSIDGLSNKDALRRLATAETGLAASHRAAAVTASGLTALLWGSLAVAAEGFASIDDAGPPPAVGLRSHRLTVLLSDVAATQEMVRQLHAIIWGYQLATGKLSVTSQARRRALAGLLRHRVLRDRLIVWLRTHQAEVPVAEAAYAPGSNPTDAGSAGALIRAMETALLPFCGLWLAAAGTVPDRELALTALSSTARAGRSWGAGVRAWPGWPD